MPKNYKQECKNCHKPYIGRGKFFCSVQCSGHIPWNKNTKGLMGSNVVGSFKKGRTPWNKGIEGIKSHLWGNKHTLGHKLTEEHRDKISFSMKGKKRPYGKVVYPLNLMG